MPQTIELPINSIPYQNVDEITLDELGDSLFDGYIDENGSPNKRPGLKEFVRLKTNKPIDSIYWWESKKVLIAVSDGRIFKITDKDGTLVELTGDKLESSGQVTFADNGNYLVMANGGRMVYTDINGPTSYITDPDAPTVVTHVAFIDFFLLAFQKDGTTVQFADFETTPTSWFAADFFTAEANPDGIKALYVNRRTIYIMGTNTIEIWTNDGFSPFSRINGATIQRGVLSPYSTVNVNDNLYFFDSRRRLTVISGASAQILTTSFDKTFQSLDTFNDVIGSYTTVLGKNWIIFNFETENRTFFLDLNGPGTSYWAEWSYMNSLTNQRESFLGRSSDFASEWNLHLWGSRKTDKILSMSNDAFNDDGQKIHFRKISGWIDYDRPINQKTSYRIKSRMKSGFGIGTSNDTKATARIRWREDGNTVWSNYITIDLEKQGNRNFFKEIQSNGSYYARQYEISMSDEAPFVIGKTVEEIDINEF
jgi:hypothetical protein